MKTRRILRVSVIVPARNEEKLLPACLDALTHQQTTIPYEILLVDSNSTDTTPDIAKSFHVRYLNEPKKGKVFGFRRGADEARGEILCFTEADCIASPNWVQSIADHFAAHPDSAAVVGLYSFYNDPLLLRVAIYPAHVIGHLGHYLWYGSHMTRGSNFAVRADIYRRIGGFSTDMSELYDTEIGHRIAKHGAVRLMLTLWVKTSPRRVHGRLLAYVRELVPAAIALMRKKPIRHQTYSHIR